jgi:diguanylate cyclase (GGDEF)-like protein
VTRANTLVLALLILNTLLGLLCLVVARGERRSAALRLWGWGLLVYSIGLLITIPAFLPFALRKVVGNSLIAFAPILTVAGALSHTHWRVRRSWILPGFIASVIPIVVNHLVAHPNVLVDILSPAPIANVLFIIAALAFLRDPPPSALYAARFVSGVFLFSVVVWTLRMITILTTIGATNDRDRADLTIALFAIAQLVIAVGSTLGMLWIEVRQMQAQLQRLADTDPLTGLPNRRAAMDRVAEELARAVRHRREFSLAVFDIDFFKRINDTHGHHAGDAALKHVSRLLDGARRAVDVVGRIGGEEFIVLFSEHDAARAVIAANRLSELVAAMPLPYANEVVLAPTLSGGVATYPEDGRDWDSLFAAADKRLYAAKSGGRNRIEGPDETMKGREAG